MIATCGSYCLPVGAVAPREDIGIRNQQEALSTCVEFCKLVVAVFQQCEQQRLSVVPIGIMRVSRCPDMTTLSNLNR